MANSTWEKFYTYTLNYLNNLHIEPCSPRKKIAKFIIAANRFANHALLPKEGKKSTKQFTRTEQNLNSNIDDTDSAYYEPTDTESESTKSTTHLPRPAKQHRRPRQQPISTRSSQKAKPSHIPVFKHKKQKQASQTKDQHRKPIIPRPCEENTTRNSDNTQTNVKQLTSPALKPPPAPTRPQQTRKSPLLPTPATPVQ